jgi:hypothetical protein
VREKERDLRQRDGERTDEVHRVVENQGRIVEFGMVYMCEAKKDKRKRTTKAKRNMRT